MFECRAFTRSGVFWQWGITTFTAVKPQQLLMKAVGSKDLMLNDNNSKTAIKNFMTHSSTKRHLREKEELQVLLSEMWRRP